MPDARVLFLGDELLLSCREAAAAILRQDGLTVVGPDASCGNAAALADACPRLLELHQPDACLICCSPYGFENTSAAAAGRTSADLGDFERALIAICQTGPRFCGRQVAFTTIPAVHVDRLGRLIGSRDAATRFQRTIDQFNQLTMNVTGQFNIVVHPLHENAAQHVDDDTAEDGFHLTASGQSRLGKEFAAAVYQTL